MRKAFPGIAAIPLFLSALAATASPRDEAWLRNAALSIAAARLDLAACGGDRCESWVSRAAEHRGIPLAVPAHLRSFAEAVGNPRSGWRGVGPAEAQALANLGRFVIGVRETADGSVRLALVLPEALVTGRDSAGSGPWIHEGSDATAAVRASLRGYADERNPDGTIWGAWERCDPHTLHHRKSLGRPDRIVREPGSLPAPPPTTVMDGAGRLRTLSLGIDLGPGRRRWGDTLPRIAGVALDSARKTLFLIGEDREGLPGIRMRDLAMACWLVSGRSPQDPMFSLDPANPKNPQGDWLKAVYLPEIMRGRGFGAVLFAADFLLKQYAFGVEVGEDGTVQPRKSAVAGFKSTVDLLQEAGGTSATPQWSRFWIVIDSMRILRATRSMVFEKVIMRVQARRQVANPGSRSGLSDAETRPDGYESRWAGLFTSRFDELAKESPDLARVRELAKALAIAKWLKEEGALPPREWIVREVETDSASNIDRITALSVAWTKTDTVPFSDAKGEGLRISRRELRLFGGVDLKVTPSWKRGDGKAEAIRNAVETESRRLPASDEFSAAIDGVSREIIAMPLAGAGLPSGGRLRRNTWECR